MSSFHEMRTIDLAFDHAVSMAVDKGINVGGLMDYLEHDGYCELWLEADDEHGRPTEEFYAVVWYKDL